MLFDGQCLQKWVSKVMQDDTTILGEMSSDCCKFHDNLDALSLET